MPSFLGLVAGVLTAPVVAPVVTGSGVSGMLRAPGSGSLRELGLMGLALEAMIRGKSMNGYGVRTIELEHEGDVRCEQIVFGK
jgi:hypothetical protein